jgi:TnpA family transposase
VTSDTASGIAFGLFRLLGYQFSPRIADLAGQRLWRIDPAAHYGPLDPASRNRINGECGGLNSHQIVGHLVRVLAHHSAGWASDDTALLALRVPPHPANTVPST